MTPSADLGSAPAAAPALRPHDERLMRLALALGERHLGLSWPNPSVGALVVDESDGEVPSETVGGLVMEGLKGLDDVAYVRFASVYKDFREAKDFEAIVGQLAGEEPAPAPKTRRGSARES